MIIKYVIEENGFYGFEHSIKWNILKKQKHINPIGTGDVIKIDGILYIVNNIRICSAREAYLWLSRYVK